MIIVHKFPSEPYTLSELLGVLHHLSFELGCSWFYNEEAELNVQMYIKGEQASSLESFLSAYLSARNFQYIVAPNNDSIHRIGQQNFAMIPISNEQISNQSSVLGKTSFFILLAGLQRKCGTFNVHLTGNAQILQIAVSVSWQKDSFPYEVGFAFGRRFRLVASSSISWFPFVEKEHRDLLTMPYTSSEGSSLVTGFGDSAQAIIKSTDSDVCIGSIFNDPLSRKLCFTKENWKSSTCVWGAPGYGKTTLCMNILLQSYRKQKINFLIIEPKKDYRRLRKILPEMKILPTLRGKNPLIPPRGCNPYEYAEVLLSLLDLATEMPPESPLPDYVRRVYHLAIAKGNYGMGYFLQLYDAVMAQMGFKGEAVNFCRAGRSRIETLFRIFCGRNFASKPFPGLDISQLLNHPTVVEMGKASTPKMITVFTYFIIAHVRMAMQCKESDTITNCLLIEEAHSILSPVINENLRFDLSNLLAEGRGHGLSLIICEQSPSRIDTQASNLCGNVFSFRVVSKPDQEYVSHQLGVTPASLNDLRKQCVIARTNSMFRQENLHVDADKQILSLPPIPDEEL